MDSYHKQIRRRLQSMAPKRAIAYVMSAQRLKPCYGQLPQADTAQIAEHGTKAGYCVCDERPATA
uniref:Uncharacterized protein n=1 Tax=Siphoviridae sp. ctLsx2 TaxID=2826254 RepID=A0A8S5QU85_9CAUD|nr:MAG TPA: hypothetical protein [Siphoviridae sp. ctLsx2]